MASIQTRRGALWVYLGLTALLVVVESAGSGPGWPLPLRAGSVFLFLFLFTAVCFGSRSARYVLSFLSAWLILRLVVSVNQDDLAVSRLLIASISILQIGCLVSTPMRVDRLW